MQADRKTFVCQQCQAECEVPEGEKRKKWCDECRVMRERERWRQKAAARALPEGHPRKPRPKGSPRKPRTAEQRRAERERAAARQGRVLRTRQEANAEMSLRWKEKREARKAEADRQREVARSEFIEQKPWRAPGLSAGERYRLRYRLDPEFNLRERLRNQIVTRRLRRRHESLTRGALKGIRPSATMERELGYTTHQLKAHIERQFSKGMTWEKFFKGEIHIDHRIPLSTFDLANDNETKRAWALTNLQPMWARDNLAKSDKVLVLL